MRLIDADALKEKFPRVAKLTMSHCTFIDRSVGVMFVRETIDEMPTIDAVEVVRCKDCKYYDVNLADGTTCFCTRLELFNEHDWFCADGERRDPCSSQDS